MKNSGFTLVELLITLAVAAVLLTTAVPSMTSMIVNNRITTQANDFIGAIQYARSESLRRSSFVTICPSSNGTSCAVLSGSSHNWAIGYIIFTDDDGDGTVDAGDDEIIRIFEELAGETTFVGDATNLRYMPTGYQNGTSTAAFTLSASNCTGDKERVININSIGRPTISKSSC